MLTLKKDVYLFKGANYVVRVNKIKRMEYRAYVFERDEFNADFPLLQIPSDFLTFSTFFKAFTFARGKTSCAI